MTAQERHTVNHLILVLQGKYDQFRSKVYQHHPQLTEYDLRLCVLLKANLSTKEIATLLNITPDSVKKAKHRLRKKIHASPKSSILQVI